ncbi:MAG TPA: sugar phosphate isomerase/epimerase [Candidatus Eisenbacteria bacterium]|nr:sugar phosphate isomerase/epimerase [Candidatus Eisenbacteria bacterium]
MAAIVGRREFLFGSAVLAASAMTPRLKAWDGGQTSFSTSAGAPIRLGVASYSFRKFGRPDVIKFMQELDTPYLNVKEGHLPMNSTAEVEQISAEYKAAGIKLTAAGAIYFTKDDKDDMRRKFEYCKAAGIPVMVAGPTPETLPGLEKFVKQYDIKIAIHNHGPEDKYYPSPLEALQAVKDMDPRMGVCIDVGHTARAGLDVPSAIRSAGPRLYDVHMKDLTNAAGKWMQVAVGDGSLPVEKIFAALIEIKYAGYVDLEYEIHEDDPMPGMTESFAYMRGVLAGMGYKA